MSKADGGPHSLGPLGAKSAWPTKISPEVLFALPRSQARALAGLRPDALAPSGEDSWVAWEFAWRSPGGWPISRVLQLSVAASSSHIVESKSLKLYLHGYARQILREEDVLARLGDELGTAVGGAVRIELLTLDDPRLHIVASAETCIDADPTEAGEGAATLGSAPSVALLGEPVCTPTEAAYVSHTFGSLCPVTSQPDWASVRLHWQGRGPKATHLRAYLASFIEHRGFHEACVEQIWRDLWQHGQLTRLAVRAHFTRRGGIEIAPMRSCVPDTALPWCRLSRQ